MLDHEKRQLVDELTRVAKKYGYTQQLRERIRNALLPALEVEEKKTMQYLLNEEEYAELKRQMSAKAMAASNRLQEICTLAAQHIPVPHNWSIDKTPRPWGCILAAPSPSYCVSEICPNPCKEWRK
jgi:hypothetical protein